MIVREVDNELLNLIGYIVQDVKIEYGAGYSVRVYADALAERFIQRNIKFKKYLALPVLIRRDNNVVSHFIDLVIEDSVLLIIIPEGGDPQKYTDFTMACLKLKQMPYGILADFNTDNTLNTVTKLYNT